MAEKLKPTQQSVERDQSRGSDSDTEPEHQQKNGNDPKHKQKTEGKDRRKVASLKELKTLLTYMKPHRLHYFFGLLSLILTGAAQLLVPQFIRRSVDTISQGSFDIGRIVSIILPLLVTALFIALGRFGWRYFIGGSARDIERSMREDMFDHLMSLDTGFYQQYSIGDLMAHATNDMQTIRMSAGIALVAAFDGIVLSIAILIIMFSQVPRLAAFVIIPLPVITFFIIFFGKLIGPLFRSVQETFSKLSDHSQETFSGIRVIKSFVKEGFFLDKFNTLNGEYRKKNMRLVTLFGLFFPIVMFLAGISIVLLLYFGGRQVLNNIITPGELIATLSYLQMLIWPMLGAGFTVNLIQRGAASLERINKILNYEPVISNVHAGVRPELNGIVSVQNLSLSIEGQEILSDVSFEIAKNSLIGITGPVGSGKTTILNCLPRLIDWDLGDIKINFRNTRDIDLYHLRSVFAYVPQNSFLFSATIRNNIGYGIDNISNEHLEELIKTASLDQDFKLFPQGWDTVVGEKGVSISGGQKQRTSLARALATNRHILLLDDPLSAVDAETEERILTALLRSISDTTTILVSHRVSTLKHCKRIIVVEAGRITQEGKHEELITQEGYYKKIATIQKASTSTGAGQQRGAL